MLCLMTWMLGNGLYPVLPIAFGSHNSLHAVDVQYKTFFVAALSSRAEIRLKISYCFST